MLVTEISHAAHIECRIDTGLEGINDLLDSCRTETYRLLDHSLAVAAVAAKLAEAFTNDAGTRQAAYAAGYLHDVGKVALPRRIHFKAGALDEDERTIMRRHPTIGADLLSSLATLDVVEAVRHHHERVDGRGYPEGLDGERIPMLARLVAAADYYVAHRERRCYRPGHSRDDSLAACITASASHLDPRFTRLLVTLRQELP